MPRAALERVPSALVRPLAEIGATLGALAAESLA
jgi:hypothetical protein